MRSPSWTASGLRGSATTLSRRGFVRRCPAGLARDSLTTRIVPESAVSEVAEELDHLAANFYLVDRDDDGLHRGIARLEANTVAFAVEALERSAAVLGVVIDDRHGDIAIVYAGLRPDHDEIAIVNVVLNHRCAAHAEREAIRRHRINRQLDELVRIFDRLDRHARR